MEDLLGRRDSRRSVWSVAAVAIGVFLGAVALFSTLHPHSFVVAAGG